VPKEDQPGEGGGIGLPAFQARPILQKLSWLIVSFDL
jgi:hypothetical protein